MQIVPVAPAPIQPSLQVQPRFAGPLMERIVYELHHNPNTQNDPNPNMPQLNGKVNQVISDLHHHNERHTLPYWPNSPIDPARVAPFWPEEQNQHLPAPAPPKRIAPIPPYYPTGVWVPYYSANSTQQKIANYDLKAGSKLKITA